MAAKVIKDFNKAVHTHHPEPKKMDITMQVVEHHLNVLTHGTFLLSCFGSLEKEAKNNQGEPNMSLLETVSGGLTRFDKTCSELTVAMGALAESVAENPQPEQLRRIPTEETGEYQLVALETDKSFSGRLDSSIWDDAVSTAAKKILDNLQERVETISAECKGHHAKGKTPWKHGLSESASVDAMLEIYENKLEKLDGAKLKEETKASEEDICKRTCI